MIKGKRVLALVPARGGSKGLPRKNMRPFCGKPLIAWSIAAGLESNHVDAVWVSTDDEEIAAIAYKYGAQVPFMRPAELATDQASSVDVIVHALGVAQASGNPFDIVVLLEPTSPLREFSDIDGALEGLIASEAATSIVGVAAVETVHPAYLFREHGGFIEPYLGQGPTGVRRQTLEPLVFIEGSVYATYIDEFLQRRSFYHDRTAGWRVPRYKAIEIDEMADFIAAEALMRAKLTGLEL